MLHYLYSTRLEMACTQCALGLSPHIPYLLLAKSLLSSFLAAQQSASPLCRSSCPRFMCSPYFQEAALQCYWTFLNAVVTILPSLLLDLVFESTVVCRVSSNLMLEHRCLLSSLKPLQTYGLHQLTS